MVIGLESDVKESKPSSFDLNGEPVGDGECNKTEISSDCPICLQPLDNKDDDRTLVKLLCDHQFHLDCIGSAFNAKNKMQCPYCRNIEKGQWLHAHGPPNQNIDEEPLSGGLHAPNLHGSIFPHDQEQLGNFLSNPDDTRNNSFTRFNEWLPLPPLEELIQNEIERHFALPAANEHPLDNVMYGLEERRSGRDGEIRNGGEGSGSGGGNNNIGGSSGSEGREGNGRSGGGGSS
ncbi:E3 ubiquitin-protein ligase RFI2 [Cardamine amara subsp. amara]|uniref:E3 ubiquitin-protein ligase RFI2 n=1 Tax=Cardamine amara subsp. amara TaxID=228776 RepID=A0ABD1BT18_CARAN